MLRKKILGRIFIFCLVIRSGKRGGGPERDNQEISKKGFSQIVKKRKVLEFIPVDAIECYCGFRVLFLSPKKYRKMFHVKQRGKWPTVSGKIAGLDSRKKILQETGIIEIQQLWQKRERSRSRFRKVF